MTSGATLETGADGEFVRLPGLYRKWEIADVIGVNSEFRVEAGGRALDGTRLFVVYQREQGQPPAVPR